jgi:hypothetical protein
MGKKVKPRETKPATTTANDAPVISPTEEGLLKRLAERRALREEESKERLIREAEMAHTRKLLQAAALLDQPHLSEPILPSPRRWAVMLVDAGHALQKIDGLLDDIIDYPPAGDGDGFEAGQLIFKELAQGADVEAVAAMLKRWIRRLGKTSNLPPRLGFSNAARGIVDYLRQIERTWDGVNWNPPSRVLADRARRSVTLPPTASETLSPASGVEVASFRQLGSSWTIQFEGHNTTIDDSIAVRRLVILLEHPFEPIEPVQLVQLERAKSNKHTIMPANYADEGSGEVSYGSRHSKEEVLDQDTIDKTRAAIQRLDDQIIGLKKSGKDASELEDEKAACVAYLAAGCNSQGASRLIPSQARKAHDAIRTAFSPLKRRLAECHPALHAHIVSSLQGSQRFYSYSPEIDPKWQIQWVLRSEGHSTTYAPKPPR